MKKNLARFSILLGLLLLLGLPAQAQFGKNKVTYEQFDWQVYASPHFDVHYYPPMEPFIEDVVSYAESAYVKISRDMDHELRFRVPLVIYKTHGEFQQTNITLAELPDGVAAFAESTQYRMVLPVDMPPDELYGLIAHELTHIFQYSFFYEGYLGRAIRGQAPLWLMEGMASYLAQDETNLDQMAIRDAVVNSLLPPIQALDRLGYLTYRYGHALFQFIEDEHGLEGMRSFLFEFKKVLLTGNLEKAFKESFGYDLDEFNRRFNRYLRQRYFPILLEKKSPDDYGAALADRRLRNAYTFSPALSPSGELIAALANSKMELDLIVISAEDGSQIKNLTKGWSNDYRNLSTEAFSGRRDLSWSPVADEIAVFARRENHWPLLVFDALTGKKRHDITLEGITQTASPAFSPDGRRIAFEGNRDGVVDLFEVDLDSGEIRNLTQDDFFDANPWYSADGSTMLYNRRIGEHWKIFSVDLSDSTKKTQLTYGAHSDLQPSYSRDGNTIYFSSDRNEYGVYNLYSLSLETGDVSQYTDVVGGLFSPVEMAERGDDRYLVYTAYFRQRFRLYRMPLRNPEAVVAADQRLAEPVEAEPFKPELQLTADADKTNPYKSRWDLDTPTFGIGVANDGTILANTRIGFTDLLGNQRFVVSAASVSDFQSYNATYINVKRRFDWGASLYDFRDFFVDRSTGLRIENRYKQTGINAFIQYPFSRHYRVEASAGVQDASYNQLVGFFPDGQPAFADTKDTLGIVGVSLVGDTTRQFERWGPVQGKRLRLNATYGPKISGDFDGDLMLYTLDFRTYKQLSRRSVLAWRVGTLMNVGDRENTYGFGGLNQLRGYEFREFFGSNLAWTQLELRFPLIDVVRFPIFALQDVRGFFFVDVGAAWFDDDQWYDPDFRIIRADYSTSTPQTIPFKFWDGDENRFQDARGSYGFGFQFFFIGGLQFNWVWSDRLPYTQYTYINPMTGLIDLNLPPTPVKADTGGTRNDFYIQYDW